MIPRLARWIESLVDRFATIMAARSADSTDRDLSHDIELDETAAVLLKRIAAKLEVDL